MKGIFKFICCGNVDDGKSTLIGRLLLDTNNVKKDQLDDALRISKQNGSDKIELSMLLDGLLDERTQQITIDVAHRYFDYNDIRFHIMDCPGHEQYTKNMAIAAASANTALIMLDATKGIQKQTLKHIEICDLFQIKDVLLCITKTDLIQTEDEKENLAKLELEINDVLKKYTFNYQILPVSAVTGYNVDKVLNFLTLKAENSIQNPKSDKSILHVYTSKLFYGKRYYFAKSMGHTKPKVNDELIVLPQCNKVHISDVFENNTFSIKENIDISKGDCLTNQALIKKNKILHKTIWFNIPTPSMLFKHGTLIRRVVNLTPDTLELDGEIIFNNIHDIKENGFGIFIDEVSKTTLGCAVFMNNQEHIQKQNNIIYVIEDNNKENRKIKADAEKNKFNPTPIILDEDDLKQNILKDGSNDALLNLIKMLKEQNHNVIVLSSKFHIPTNDFSIIKIGD